MTFVSFRRALSRAWLAAGIGLAALSIAACSGSGGGTAGATAGQGPQPPSSLSCDPANASTASECGVLLVGITDADGDIVSYSVDVLSLTLERADGSIIETLPSTTRIDFAQLTDVSELLSVQRVVPGEFTGGSIRLDFSEAEILVEIGGEIVAAEVVDESRNPMGIADFTIQLPDNDHLILRRGHKSFLSVDFDLAATHELDASTVPPQRCRGRAGNREGAPCSRDSDRRRRR